MNAKLRRFMRAIPAFVDVRLLRWRTGTPEGQRAVVMALSGLAVVMLMFSLADYSTVPAVWFFVPILVGAVALQHRYLLVLVGVVTVCMAGTVTVETVENGMTSTRISTLIALGLAVGVVLMESSRNRSGLPSALSEAMLSDLRDRLQAQGTVPELPRGWTSQSAVVSASGGRYGGDFLVANLSNDGSQLEMVLVDVCGKGVTAGTQSLQFAGALGGLIGALPPVGLFDAANEFLLRQRRDESFATAVHVLVDLNAGTYSITNAGHPPAMSWNSIQHAWEVDGARGTALGVTDSPEFFQTSGRLDAGDGLMFYTDGVVESRSRDVASGVAWLQQVARRAVRLGFSGAPERILAEVAQGDDDRAVLMLHRTADVVPGRSPVAVEKSVVQP